MHDKRVPVYPIRTVSRLTAVKSGQIRAWERHSLLKPHRTEGGHRLFSEEDVDRVRRIKAMRDDGMSLRTVQRLLRDPHPEAVPRQERAGTANAAAESDSEPAVAP